MAVKRKVRIFRFCGELAYSADLQRYLYAHIMERNAIVREVAQQTGAPLVDLCAEFDTETLSDFRENFHDVAHLHPYAYPRAAEALYRGVRQLL